MTIIEEAIKDIDVDQALISFGDFGDKLLRNVLNIPAELEPVTTKSFDDKNHLNYRHHIKLCDYRSNNPVGYYQVDMIVQITNEKELRLIEFNIRYSTLRSFDHTIIDIWYKDDNFSPNGICNIDIHKDGEDLINYYANINDCFIDFFKDEQQYMKWYYSSPKVQHDDLDNPIFAALKIAAKYYYNL